jgi:hypothetical protein
MVAIAAGIVLADCGSNSPSAGSAGGVSVNPRLTRIHNESVRFTRCIALAGCRTSPIPPSNGGYGLKSLAQQSNGHTLSINGVSVSTPAFRSAMVQCRRYLPQSPPATSTALAPAQRPRSARAAPAQRPRSARAAPARCGMGGACASMGSTSP